MRSVSCSMSSPRSSQPGGAEIDAGVLLEIVLVALPAAHEQRDAIVRARDDQRQRARRQARRAVAAQRVTQQHRFVLLGSVWSIAS